MSVPSQEFADEPLVIGSHSFNSRLFVGTGKYRDNDETVKALEVSGTGCVTVALRRVDLKRAEGPNLLDATPHRRRRRRATLRSAGVRRRCLRAG